MQTRTRNSGSFQLSPVFSEGKALTNNSKSSLTLGTYTHVEAFSWEIFAESDISGSEWLEGPWFTKSLTLKTSTRNPVLDVRLLQHSTT